MKKIQINIVDDILKSTMALHQFGVPVKKVLSKEIADITEPTLFILNLRNADPLDYEFINISFAELIEKYQGNLNMYIAFKAGKWETEELYTGITKILKLNNNNGKSDKDILQDCGVHLLVINDEDEAIYTTNLSKQHMEILNEIEKTQKITSAEIQQKFGLNAEDTYKILSELVKSKFVYLSEGPCYHPINALI